MRGSKTVKRATKLVEQLNCSAAIHELDIKNSKGCDPRRCMYHTSIAREFCDQFKCSIGDLHLTVRSTGIRFHYRGHRWHAPLAKKMETSIKTYDREWKLWLKAKRKDPDITFQPTIEPHTVKFVATRGSKIIPVPRDRQDRINQNRRDRAATGKPDKKYHSMSQRVVAM